jgi:serine/threonine protein kinase
MLNPGDSCRRHPERKSGRQEHHPEDRRSEPPRPSRQSRKPQVGDRAAARDARSHSAAASPADDRRSSRDKDQHPRNRKRRERSRSCSEEESRDRRKRRRPRSRSRERSRHGRRRREGGGGGGRQRYRDRRSGSSYSEAPAPAPADEAPPRSGVVSVDEDLPGRKATATGDARGKNQAKGRSQSTHDDTVGHFRGESGTVIADRYRILKQVGLGTFGRVVECLDLKQGNTGKTSRRRQYRETEGHHVALKIVRNVKRYYESALIEASVVEEVNRRGGRGMTHCVVMHDAFTFENHFCMVFESLGPSLYDFLKRHNYQPFPLVCIQDFAVQLLETLEFLHSFRLIHTDLKIENVLLMNDREVTYGYQRVPESTRIKVIDFGGACYDDDKKSSVINTRQYRAPEVILGTGWSMPSDMWSAGCILAELYQGELLFSTHDNLEHLALMERMVGPFPRRLLKKAKANSHLAKEAFDSNDRHRMDRVLPAENSLFVKKSVALEAIVRREEELWFLSLLRKMLVIDPTERATAHECLQYLSRIRKDVVRYT